MISALIPCASFISNMYNRVREFGNKRFQYCREDHVAQDVNCTELSMMEWHSHDSMALNSKGLTLQNIPIALILIMKCNNWSDC